MDEQVNCEWRTMYNTFTDISRLQRETDFLFYIFFLFLLITQLNSCNGSSWLHRVSLLLRAVGHLSSSFLSTGSTAPVGPGLSFSVSWLFADGKTPWTSDQLVARPLPKHRTTQTQNKLIHTTNIHALCGITNSRSRLPSERRQFML
jgi:hypothetical protein